MSPSSGCLTSKGVRRLRIPPLAIDVWGRDAVLSQLLRESLRVGEREPQTEHLILLLMQLMQQYRMQRQKN